MIEGKHRKIKKRLYVLIFSYNNIGLEAKARGFLEAQVRKTAHTQEELRRYSQKKGEMYQQMLGLFS